MPSVSQYSTQATEGQVESDDSDQAMVSSWVWMAGWPYLKHFPKLEVAMIMMILFV